MSWGSSAARFLASASTVLVVRWLRRHSQQRALLRVWSAKRRPVTTVDATIRLPKEDLDPDLAGCDSVAQLRERIAKLGLPPLVPREMHRCSVSLAGRARKLLGLTTSFTVMQFNLLAEGLSSGPHVEPPFGRAGVKPSGYGGFDAVARPEVVFDWSKRKLRLVEEILRFLPDVLTVQECDHFADFLLPALRTAGYDGVYAPKRHSPCLEFGYHSDGVAILWKKSAFAPIGSERRYFIEDDGSESGRPYLLALLRHRECDSTLLVATTHMKAKLSQPNEDLRAKQITQLLDALEESAADKADALMLCGDFNTDPYDEPGKQVAKCVPAVLGHRLGLRSAYPLPRSEHDGWWTTWKKRGASEVKHTIDYIFHSSGLQPTSVLAPPAVDDLEEARLPGIRYPSDHLSIMAEIIIS